MKDCRAVLEAADESCNTTVPEAPGMQQYHRGNNGFTVRGLVCLQLQSLPAKVYAAEVLHLPQQEID